MTNASNTQIGGDHYKAMGEFQPWDVLQHWLTPEQFNGFLLGSAIAYLGRYNTTGVAGKGGTIDLQKAAHYLDKLIEVQNASSRGA